MVSSGFREYEVKKLRFPACSGQENATFPPHVHGNHKVHPCSNEGKIHIQNSREKAGKKSKILWTSHMEAPSGMREKDRQC